MITKEEFLDSLSHYKNNRDNRLEKKSHDILMKYLEQQEEGKELEEIEKEFKYFYCNPDKNLSTMFHFKETINMKSFSC